MISNPVAVGIGGGSLQKASLTIVMSGTFGYVESGEYRTVVQNDDATPINVTVDCPSIVVLHNDFTGDVSYSGGITQLFSNATSTNAAASFFVTGDGSIDFPTAPNGGTPGPIKPGDIVLG